MSQQGFTRREFLGRMGALAAAAGMGTPAAGAAGARRPNIILVEPDSWDGRVLGFLGHPAMRRATPNIDRLARRGTAIRANYCSNPICCPSRASMWSGQHTWHCEGWNNYKGLEPGTPTAFSRLHDAGYTLASDKGGLGKMDHLSGAHSLMNRLGAWTAPAGVELPILEMAAPKIEDNDDAVVHKADWQKVRQAKAFLREHKGDANPFFLYLGLSAPHPPFTTNRRYLGLVDREAITVPPEDKELHPVMRYMRTTKDWQHGFDREAVLRTRAIYYAMCAEVDAMIGELLDTLDALGLAENTYFIFISDHGENNMEHRQWYKMNLYESAARVPLVVAGPGVRRGAVLNNVTSLVDLYPTLMEMAGVAAPTGLDGESLLPLLTGKTEKSRDNAVAMYSDILANTTLYMLRQGDWKYVAYPGFEPQLFNLAKDPEEIENLARTQPEIARQMDKALRKIVDYPAVHRRVIDYDKASFRAWREQALAGKARNISAGGAEGKALTYDQAMGVCYRGWGPEHAEKVNRWLEAKE